MPRFIFRMTHYRNVERQMIDGRIYARNNPNGQPRYSICYDEIVHRRGAEQYTPNSVNLNHYVPFYFSPATAMAFAIKGGKVNFKTPGGEDLGPGSNEHVVFYICNPTRVHHAELEYWFTDIACNSGLAPNFSNDIQMIEEHVSWNLFDEPPKMGNIPEIGYNGACQWFHDRDEPLRYQNRKKERMAEFLVRDHFPVELIDCIVTKNDRIRTQVEHWVNVNGRNTNVYTKRGCFY